ncbi:MAG TPA: hypothetical protein VIG33_01180 [Pseudobdellovibrionaceae bacterium]
MIKFTFLASLVISINAQAQQQIHVEKIKGNRAVVEFSGSLIPGKTYSLSINKTEPPEETAGGKRQYIIGGSLGFNSTSYTVPSLNTTLKNSDINVFIRFGWNKESFEFGPIFGYKNIDSDYTDRHYSSFSGGAFADYNLTANRLGETKIFGITSEGIVGSLTPKTGDGGSTLEFFGGGFFKWFGITDSTALRFDMGYSYIKTTAGASSDTLQGLVLRGGIATYF